MAADTTLSGGNNDVILGSSVNGAHALTVNSGGITHIDGAVNIASLTTDAAGTTSLAVSGGSITTSGAQTYNDAVVLGADTTLSTTQANFNNTLDGAQALTVSGNAGFSGAVGGVTALTSLAVTGVASFGGSEVITSGAQQYGATTVTSSLITFATTGGAATGANITFASLAGQVGTEHVALNAGTGGAVTVTGTTSNLGTLELVNAGSATFDGAVTIGTLTVDSSGASVALLGNGTDIVNAVSFNNLGGTTLNAGAGGTETFEGGLTSAAGTTTLGNTIATTSGSQSYGAWCWRRIPPSAAATTMSSSAAR